EHPERNEAKRKCSRRTLTYRNLVLINLSLDRNYSPSRMFRCFFNIESRLVRIFKPINALGDNLREGRQLIYDMSVLKKTNLEEWRRICGGAGAARTPTYIGPLLEVGF
ncbi:MAG: hypothetical protein KAT23_05280, partial [Anaerolineales bacterium]|nr:hypothetical protein [Anaerolineales bacterium]